MRTITKAVVMCAMVMMAAGFAQAEVYKTAPKPEKMRKLRFPKYKEFHLKNGLDVVVVEHHEQPVASVWLAIRAGSTLDPKGKSSLAEFVAAEINKGTKTHNADELAKWIESKGGAFNATAGDDYTSLSVSILSQFLPTAYEYLSELVNDATFPADELETERKRVKTGLEFELSDPTSMAGRYFRQIVYGQHPYGRSPVKETVDAVTQDDLSSFYSRNYVANNTVMFVVGDVREKDVKKAAKKYFGAWRTGTPEHVQYAAPPERTASNISLYHRPGSVQTNLYVGHLGLRPNDPDWPEVTVMNRILGGGATGRLFMHLREAKGLTYGAYSRFTKPEDIGYFRATANVRTAVTDSALTALLDELHSITTAAVSDSELTDAKSYLIGNFPTTIETPEQIARQIAQIKMLGLDKSYLETYRQKIAKVSQADVLHAAQAHIHPDRLAIVAVGDATKILDKLKPIAPVALYDIEGNAIKPSALAVVASNFEFDLSGLKDMTAVYSVKVQDTMDLGDMENSLKRANDHFDATSKITGMIAMNESASFGDKNFSPMDYKFSMSAMGNEMSAQYTFADGRAKGTVNGPKGEKDIDVALVKGTLLGASLEYLVATLPLKEGAEYAFPTFDAQSGTLQNVKIVVEGAEDLMVPAGSYATIRVRVKRSDGEQILYVTKDSPHVVVKQELPAQKLKMELKSLKM